MASLMHPVARAIGLDVGSMAEELDVADAIVAVVEFDDADLVRASARREAAAYLRGWGNPVRGETTAMMPAVRPYRSTDAKRDDVVFGPFRW